jgi:predicted Abi (CAAX) family protease
MKSKNVFISHRGKDDEHIGKLKELLNKKGYQLKNSSIDSSRPNNANNEEYIKTILRPRIEWAGTFICLIGKDTANSNWVKWEIEHAAKEGKNIVGVYLHGEKSEETKLPEALETHADSIVGWNTDKIIEAVGGKNIMENPDGSPRTGGAPIGRETC